MIGKIKSFLLGVFAFLSSVLGLLFLFQTHRLRKVQEEKEDLEEENREQKEVIENITDDMHLAERIRQRDKEIDQKTSEEVRKIESASDDDVLDRLNRMYN